jgi:hypothetical protein
MLPFAAAAPLLPGVAKGKCSASSLPCHSICHLIGATGLSHLDEQRFGPLPHDSPLRTRAMVVFR